MSISHRLRFAINIFEAINGMDYGQIGNNKGNYIVNRLKCVWIFTNEKWLIGFEYKLKDNFLVKI